MQRAAAEVTLLRVLLNATTRTMLSLDDGQRLHQDIEQALFHAQNLGSSTPSDIGSDIRSDISVNSSFAQEVEYDDDVTACSLSPSPTTSRFASSSHTSARRRIVVVRNDDQDHQRWLNILRRRQEEVTKSNTQLLQAAQSKAQLLVAHKAPRYVISRIC